MTISITITDPTNEEALRIADYLYDLAGYRKQIVEPSRAEVAEQVQRAVEAVAESAPSEPEEVYSPNTVVIEPPAAHVLPKAPPPPVTPDRDARGLPWDERIHASSKARVADGTWRARRNVDAALVEAVERELLGQTSIPMPEQMPAVAPPPPVVAAPQPPVVPVPPAPPAGYPFLPTDTPQSVTFAQFMQRITPKLTTGELTHDTIKAVLNANGIESLPYLAQSPAVIPAVALALGV